MSQSLQKDDLPWHAIPPSKDDSICSVSLLQAGSLTIPYSLVLLPAPDTAAPTFSSREEANKENFLAPDFCFLIEHVASKTKYIFDLGMRKDLNNSPPAVKARLPDFNCFPESPAEILVQHTPEQHHPSSIKAVIFSHLHFDHVGDAGAAGFSHAELWVGPTSMTQARPGYPQDPQSSTWSADFPTDGSKKIVELTVPEALLEAQHDNRLSDLQSSVVSGKYEGVEQQVPKSGWFPLGSFERACDLFGDGSAYLIDAPGHSAGHIMLLVRVKVNRDSDDDDDFVLLAGDCFHHVALLREPRRTARPPFCSRTMHGDPERAVDSIARTARFAAQPNVWVVGAHDSKVLEAVGQGKSAVSGLVDLVDWRKNRWKGDQV